MNILKTFSWTRQEVDEAEIETNFKRMFKQI